MRFWVLHGACVYTQRFALSTWNDGLWVKWRIEGWSVGESVFNSPYFCKSKLSLLFWKKGVFCVVERGGLYIVFVPIAAC